MVFPTVSASIATPQFVDAHDLDHNLDPDLDHDLDPDPDPDPDLDLDHCRDHDNDLNLDLDHDLDHDFNPNQFSMGGRCIRRISSAACCWPFSSSQSA